MDTPHKTIILLSKSAHCWYCKRITQMTKTNGVWYCNVCHLKER